MANFDDLKLSVEAISGGKNTVVFDDIEMPSIVVPFPKLKYSDVIIGGTQDPLPAFIVDGEEVDAIHVSKYQNIIVNDRAYSLPFKDPAANLNFDRALVVCRNKGSGWHLNTNALFAAITLWCHKNGTIPHGSSQYGEDYSNPHEKGIPTYMYKESQAGRCATGSGPITWYHNYDSSGIADLMGNVCEWVSGIRLAAGEIQIIPYGNAMKHSCNMSATSNEWKAVMPDGAFVNPGSTGTLKLDYVNSKWTICTTITSLSDSSRNGEFLKTTAATGVLVPQVMKGLGLIPVPDFTYGNGHFNANNVAEERLPFRGASSLDKSNAGITALELKYPRTTTSSAIGFRAAFCEKLKTA